MRRKDIRLALMGSAMAFVSSTSAQASAEESKSSVQVGAALLTPTLAQAAAAGGEQSAQSAPPAESFPTSSGTVPESVAPAQAAEPAGGATFGDIIVTARRANESLQRVPIAVSVLSNDTLAKNNIVDSFGLLSQIPGVQNITRNVGNPGTALLFKVRGVAPVAYYFNEAPLPLPQSQLYAPFFDLGNVQVLKGPQGTLFGQASNAGAMINTPRRPGEVFGGYAKASAGNYGFKSIEGAIDVPLIKDQLFLRVAGIAYSRDGYIKDSISGLGIEGIAKYEIGRATLVWKPSSNFENTMLFQAEFVHDQTGGASGTPGDYNMFDNALNRSIAAVNGMTLAQLFAARDQIMANQKKIGPYRTQGWSVGCPASDLRPATSSTVPGPNLEGVVPQPCPPGGGFFHAYSAYNTTIWNFADDFSVKNIVSHVWGKQKFQAAFDNDGTRLIGNEANVRNDAYTQPMANSWSEELQVNGKVGALDFVLGGFYYNEKPLNQKNPSFGNFTTSIAQSASQTFTRNRSVAAYAQGNYDLSSLIDGLTVTAGLRHTWDTSHRRQNVLDPTTLQIVSTNGGPNTPTGEAHWEYTTYTASAQYQISPKTMVYINNSKGSSSGGLQNNARAPSYDPDTLNNLEAGIKTTFETGNFRLRANAAGYYGWYNNVKVSTIQLLPAAPGSPNLVLTPTTANAAAARIKGFELELNGSLGDFFEFGAFVSHDNPKYKRFDFTNPLTLQQVNLKDQPFALAPKWKFGFTPTIHLPVDPQSVGRISVGANFTFRTQMWVNPVKPIIPNDPANKDTGAICKLRRTAANGYGPLSADGRWAYKDCAPSFYNVNLNINWDEVLGNDGLHLGLTITNLTKNSRIAGVNSQYDTLNTNGYQPAEPRMIYATLGYNF